MHAALQCRAHSPQLLHLETSITGLKREYLAMVPRNVPTGQIVLQYVRPFRHANKTNTPNVIKAMIKVERLFTHTSTS